MHNTLYSHSVFLVPYFSPPSKPFFPYFHFFHLLLVMLHHELIAINLNYNSFSVYTSILTTFFCFPFFLNFHYCYTYFHYLYLNNDYNYSSSTYSSYCHKGLEDDDKKTQKNLKLPSLSFSIPRRRH